MSIILIRHGETDANFNRVVQVPQTPLNSRGVAQAQALGVRLAKELAGQAIRLVSSDLTRAEMTADLIGRALGAKLAYQPLLQERNFGDLRGRSYAEIGTDIMAPGYAPPAGETWDTFNQRVAKAWDWLKAELSGSPTIVAVSHGLVCRSLAANHFKIEDGLEIPRHWGNTSVSIVDRRPPYQAQVLNCTRHLDALTADRVPMSGI